MVLIGAVMLVVAVRTMKYNKARDRAYAAYRKAVGMLRSEFKENLDLAEKMRDEVTRITLSKDRFRTQAWALLLAAPIWGQMDEEASTDLRQIYNHIEEAETYRSQLIEMSNKQAGLQISVQKGCLTSLLRTLNELTIGLQRHLARVSEDS